jgi:predicted adenine nucleotide alpha hydrolase (AANH) superfamily ATPase
MGKNKRVLLHCCCAPDSTVPLTRLLEEGYQVVCAFYGSNIHPEEEYRWRLEDMKKVASEKGVRLLVPSYQPAKWLQHCGKLPEEKEGGARCGACFSLQLLAAARCAMEENCGLLCTTLTISPHKDPLLLRRIGEAVAGKKSLIWLDRIWRKNGGFAESVREGHRMGLRRQTYCGCVFSRKEDEAG